MVKTVNINKDNFPDLVNKLIELAKISDTIKMKIDNDETLIYSMIGETAILAFKSYVISTRNYFDFSEDFDGTLDFVIIGSKRFVKKLSFFDVDKGIKMKLNIKENADGIFNIRTMNLTDGRLKVNQISGEPYKIRNINKIQLKSLLNIDNAETSFQVKHEDFQDVKKLSAISEDPNILISSVNGNIYMSEQGKWELNMGEANSAIRDISFSKKYLKSIINTETILNFLLFETFLLFTEDNMNFMVAYDQYFEDDE